MGFSNVPPPGLAGRLNPDRSASLLTQEQINTFVLVKRPFKVDFSYQTRYGVASLKGTMG